MKKSISILTLTIFVALITSCSNILDNNIEISTIENDIMEINSQNPDMDSINANVLGILLALSQGRDNYIKKIRTNEGTSSLENYIVDDDKFKEVTDNIFNYFKANKITYRAFLNEIDSLNTLNERYSNDIQSVYEEIDKLCLEKQKEMTAKDKKADEIMAKLNKMVDLEILSIRETEYSYRDVIEVKIKMINKTDKRIEAIGFNMVLTDKLGTQIAILNCKSNDGFNATDIGTWTYDKWDKSDIYESLKNVNVTHITAKQEITKINLAGELISAYDFEIEDLLDINYEYVTPKELTGYCPYLDDENDLMKKIVNSREEKGKEIDDRFPLLKKYQDFAGKLFDTSKYSDEI